MSKRVKKILKWTLRLGVLGIVLGFLGIGLAYYLYGRDLPDVDSLRDVQLEVPLRIFSADGKLMGVFGERRRVPATYEQIPACIRNAFLAGEDARFFEHPGVDWQGVSRAVLHLIRTGDKSIGGSTITQQLARNFFLSFEKTWVRKIKEAFLAIKIERELSKEEILELYLNKIFLGHRSYGVGAAAQVYYGKELGELSTAQCAMIAALPKAPSRINPITSPERALERRDYVLNRMLELEHIDAATHAEAIEEKDQAFYHGPTVELNAPYVAEMVRAEAINRLGEAAYVGGFEVITTLHSELQEAANRALKNGLESYDQRHGYRGPEAHFELPSNATTEQWDQALDGYRALAGLEPGLVVQADQESGLVYLSDGQTIALDLASVEWARPYIDTDTRGEAPTQVDQVIKTGDIIRLRRTEEAWQLAQFPDVEGSLISLDPETGAIRALTGGYEFERSKFNRAVQGRRQPGSSFKPFIYSAAIEQGYSTATMVNDAPVVYRDAQLERTWKPQNFSERVYGPTRLREAMVNSRNLVSIRLLEDIGIPFARQYISQFGFQEDELPPDLSMALGSATLVPLSIAAGYSTFANGGYAIEPYYIESIADANGKMLMSANPTVVCRRCPDYESIKSRLAREAAEREAEAQALAASLSDPQEATPERLVLDLSETANNEGKETDGNDAAALLGPPLPNTARRVISEQNAYLVRSMMLDVVRRGTGRRAMELGRNDLAGKTGTTNEQRDAWFSGFNSTVVTTVWVGFDDHQPLGRGELGGAAALPIWMEFMKTALEGTLDTPPIMPSGIVQARINPESGLLAGIRDSGIMEVFRRENMPEADEGTRNNDEDGAEEENPYDLF